MLRAAAAESAAALAAAAKHIDPSNEKADLCRLEPTHLEAHTSALSLSIFPPLLANQFPSSLLHRLVVTTTSSKILCVPSNANMWFVKTLK